jgi:CheY-like chemotaxis protein
MVINRVSVKDIEMLEDKTILIVDDNADNRVILTELLFEWKIKPVVCASALEALRLIMGNRYKFDLRRCPRAPP